MHIARYVKNTKKTAFFTQNRWFLPSKPWFCPISPYIRTWKSPKKCEKTLMRYQGFSRFFGPNPSIWDLQNHQKPWFWSVLPTPPKIIKNRLNFALSEKFSKPAKITIFTYFDVEITRLQAIASTWIYRKGPSFLVYHGPP